MLQDEIVFKHLGLAIIDKKTDLGAQRLLLREKKPDASPTDCGNTNSADIGHDAFC